MIVSERRHPDIAYRALVPCFLIMPLHYNNAFSQYLEATYAAPLRDVDAPSVFSSISFLAGQGMSPITRLTKKTLASGFDALFSVFPWQIDA